MSDTDSNALGHYRLVGGSFTPERLVGSALDDLSTDELLNISHEAPIPGLATPDPADADVLAIRAYLASPGGLLRLAMAGNLSSAFDPDGDSETWPPFDDQIQTWKPGGGAEDV